jgi:hypothetical protein
VKAKDWLISAGILSISAAILMQSAVCTATKSAKAAEDDWPSYPSTGAAPLYLPSDAAKPIKGEPKESADAEKKTNSSAGEQTIDSASEEQAALPKKPKIELTKTQIALRDQLRQTLSAFQKQAFSTRQNTADDILDFCLPYGCSTEITIFEKSGERRANGITALCWNYSCGGFEPLAINDGRIVARVGYGLQSQPSQMLAMLAFARVQANYPLRVEKAVRTVADLVESEKLSCRSDADLSLKLIGLTYYVDDASWKNDQGEEWTLERIVREELDRTVSNAGSCGLNRLMGLAYVNYRREKRDQALEGQFARAEKYLVDFHKYAFELQNADGSWGYFLSARGANKDAVEQLRSTAYVLEWLSISLSDEELANPRIAAAATSVLQGLNTQRNRSSLPGLPSKEIDAATHALHALALYDDRFFKPSDADSPPAAKLGSEKPAAASSAKTAAR